MQKTLVPATFLTAVLKADKTIIKSEDHLYVIREAEKNTASKVSYLHSLFFGNEQRKQNRSSTMQELISADPNYYSSYE